MTRNATQDIQNQDQAEQANATIENPSAIVDTECLIVGCGPAGASLACFLTSYGLKGIMIGAAPGTAHTPRAHITNMAALECLRDIGLERDVHQVSSKGHCMIHTRWCHSMAGEEFARLYSWGNDPARKGDYELASPCEPVDVPQTLLEPILIRHASHNGFKVSFNTALESFEEDPKSGLITAHIRDKISNLTYKIRTKYLIGADGAQSQVVKQFDLPLIRKPSQGVALNVLVKADLSHLVDSRQGNLHWVMQPDREHPEFGWIGIVRMVKPWDEWMFIIFPNRDWNTSVQPTEEQYLQRVRDFIGDDTPAEILNVAKWFVNETVAEKYSQGNVYCLGDAVHRHPPFNGLGSNTCIQDAFNLAWKLAYVHNGWAEKDLLETYSHERQPVGQSIITRANDAFRDHTHVWNAIGALPADDVEARRRVLEELKSPTPEGEQRRKEFRTAIKKTSREFHGLGIEMNQQYTSSGIYEADEPEPYSPSGRAKEDSVLYHEQSTYPGRRLPHVWLNTTIPSEAVTTIDLAGKGCFVLFTGIGGDRWKVAAERVATDLKVPLKVHIIGFRQQWEDFYFRWEEVRGVEDSGVVLVRPDRFVAWRAPRVLDSEDACAEKLGLVLRTVLGMSKQIR
ncbi:hypothetical protein FOVSG1_010077 [Fusarium oxysporum f. sp. vasinfectum]